MRGDTDAQVAERDRIASELAELDEKHLNLKRELAEIARKAEEAAGNAEGLSQLKIETEQLTEAKHMNDRMISETKKRFTVIEDIISMQEQSDIV